MLSTLKGTKVQVGDRVIYRTAFTFGDATITHITPKGRIRVNDKLFTKEGLGVGTGKGIVIQPYNAVEQAEIQARAGNHIKRADLAAFYFHAIDQQTVDDIHALLVKRGYLKP